MKKEIYNLRAQMNIEQIDPENGLGTDLFLMVSSMTPIVNIDMFITDETGRVLLSWRDDKHCGQGWHIPGGCLRFKETLDRRIHLTALNELGSDVSYDPRPLLVRENIATDELTIRQNHNERAHFISLLYHCRVQDAAALKDCDGKEIVGHLKWFNRLPENFIEIQYYYCGFLKNWFAK
ncbi:MAG: NUDIX domain-containing protein [Lachnospiraceae bacterium]|nr:NUDIX domain-containing protein [Lachnospiraceae bacterium]